MLRFVSAGLRTSRAIIDGVDPSRKRTIRFVVALSAAVLLAGALAYTSFSASTEARQPSELANAAPTPGKKYQLVGKVVAGYKQKGDTTYFRVRDRNGKASVPVTYKRSAAGPVPRRPRGRGRRGQEGRRLRRADGLAGDEVPLEVHGRQDADLTCWSRAKPA